MAEAKSEKKNPADTGISVVLLGTGTPLPNPERACASTLVTCGSALFLVDTGRGFLNNLARFGINDVTAVFFTHFHSDHFAEFGELMVNRTIRGANQPLRVFGPAGVKQVISSLLGAYSLDNGYRKAHHGDKWDERGMQADIHEKKPGIVYDRDGVRVRMFDVSHHPVAPAVGYRFDYCGSAVVISGDTVSVPLTAEVAKGVDILVHDAAQQQMVQGMTQFLKSNPDPAAQRLAAMTEEMLAYHASTGEIGRLAAEAGVKKLVLTHLVPSIPANADESPFTAGITPVFKGTVLVGKDGMRINTWD